MDWRNNLFYHSFFLWIFLAQLKNNNKMSAETKINLWCRPLCCTNSATWPEKLSKKNHSEIYLWNSNCSGRWYMVLVFGQLQSHVIIQNWIEIGIFVARDWLRGRTYWIRRSTSMMTRNRSTSGINWWSTYGVRCLGYLCLE